MYDRAPRSSMPDDLVETTTDAQVKPSRLRSAHNASASKATVACNAGLSNSRMEADGALQPSLSPAERLKIMDLRPWPWPKAAQPAPTFVLRGKLMDTVLKLHLWAILSSGMVTLNDMRGSSIADEARWRKQLWLPPSTGHSKQERARHLWKARVALRRVLRACAKHPPHASECALYMLCGLVLTGDGQ